MVNNYPASAIAPIPWSVRSDDLSRLNVDEDVFLAAVLRLDLNHVDVLAALPLNLHVSHLAWNSLQRDLRCLFFRDLCRGRLLRLRSRRVRREENGEQTREQTREDRLPH